MRILNCSNGLGRMEKRGSKSEVAGGGHAAIARIIMTRVCIASGIGGLRHIHLGASGGAGSRARHGPDRRSDQHKNHEQGDAAHGFHALSKTLMLFKYKGPGLTPP